MSAYISTQLPFVRIEIFDGNLKIHDTLTKPDGVDKILKDFNVKEVTQV